MSNRYSTVRKVRSVNTVCIKYSRFITCQSDTSKGRGHDCLPNWNPKNGGMLISQPISRCLTNDSELCMSRLLNNQPRRISIYRLQRRPSFGFESSVSLTPMTSGDPVSVNKVRKQKYGRSGRSWREFSSSDLWYSQKVLLYLFVTYKLAVIRDYAVE